MYKDLIGLIQKTMITNGYKLQEIETVNAVNKRKNGVTFELEDHIAGMVYALLSNQRPWKQVEENYEAIRSIFHGFNPDYLQSVNPSILVKEIRDIRCGNRSINSQMNGLGYNISQFDRITELYGSMDNFVTSDSPNVIAKSLSSGEYKLKQMGTALTMEYLKNVGIDTIKPDIHIRRLFGKDRLGFSDKILATEDETIEIVRQMSIETSLLCAEIDSIIWQFCATDYAEICSSNPHCDKCLLKCKKKINN